MARRPEFYFDPKTQYYRKRVKLQSGLAALVRALENAKGKSEKNVTFKRSPSEASRTDIQKMFGVAQGET